MNKNRRNKATETEEFCSYCDRPGVEDLREDVLYKGVLIENVPAKRCPNCHEIYYDLQTVKLMEQIAKTPERYARMLKRPVARVA